MRIVHLAVYHKAQDSRIFVKECCSLAEAGYEVILGIPEPPTQSFANLSFMATNNPQYKGNKLSRFFIRLRSAFRVASQVKGDVFHIHEPLLIIVGVVLKLQGFMVIYDIHDDAAQQALNNTNAGPLTSRIISLVWLTLDLVARVLFDGFVAATPRLAEGYPPQKTVVVQNFPRLEEFSLHVLSDCNSELPSLVYVGTIFKERGITEMMKALETVSKNETEVILNLAGVFHPPKLLDALQSMAGWKHVKFFGWLERSDTLSLLKCSDIGLILFHPIPNYIESYPIKLFEYMNAGIPVIASNFDLWRQIIREELCGIVVDPYDIEQIASAIQYLIRNPEEARAMGERGRLAVKHKYNWRNEEVKLLDFYERLCNSL